MPLWDIARRPVGEQFGYWREVICQAFVPLAPERTTDRAGFPSQVEERALGTLNRAQIRSQPQRVAHGRREVARSRGAYYFVNLQLAGRCAVRQGRAESILTRGQFAVLDTTEPYYLDFDSDWRMLSFRVPHEQLRGRLADPRLGTGIGIDAGAGTGAVVAALMRSLWELDGPTGAGAAAELEQSFAAVTAVAMGSVAMGSLAMGSHAMGSHAMGSAPPGSEPAGDRLSHPGIRAAVLRFVLANLGEEDLSVATVCRRFAISPRLLHTLFADQPASFAGTVRGLRLDRCARLIADPHTTGSITEIAARHGYPDPASFSRAFRRQFGVAPRDVRAQPPSQLPPGQAPASQLAPGQHSPSQHSPGQHSPSQRAPGQRAPGQASPSQLADGS
ncbi:MAG TPA: helix-turn-helix domain-containing protein [Pseudonocardia sp.]|nr:helix-turn-helix domain-containing protein [Pseudonocardia sp.]